MDVPYATDAYEENFNRERRERVVERVEIIKWRQLARNTDGKIQVEFLVFFVIELFVHFFLVCALERDITREISLPTRFVFVSPKNESSRAVLHTFSTILFLFAHCDIKN